MKNKINEEHETDLTKWSFSGRFFFLTDGKDNLLFLRFVQFELTEYSNTESQRWGKNPHKKQHWGEDSASEEDGSSASALLIAHDSLRLANYAL